MKKEAENDRVILSGESKGLKKHNRRAKALLARAGVRRPTAGQTRAPAAPWGQRGCVKSLRAASERRWLRGVQRTLS